MNRLLLLFFAFLFSLSVSAKKEVIRFNLKLGFIKGGEAELTITDTVFNNKPAIKYHINGRTTGLANTLYAVNDTYETIVDAETHLPLKAIRNIREKKYRWYNETLFYHDIDSLNSQRSGWHEMPENTVDMVSSFFYFVLKNNIDEMEPNNEIELASFHADKIDTVTVKYLGTEVIKTDLGEIDSYVLSPVVAKGKLFKRSNAMKFYISRELKLPVLLDFEMKVGALRAVLRSYKIDGVEQITK
jgi:hypothetical protein